ncbi:MAG: (2Fe-2S)-binding protein [Armatimonadetes bacterium]|nr:(2Fe-2S)-binding protein [Armatimonadota bacterium]
MRQLVELTVNGETRECVIEARTRLLDALREGLGLTGAKEGCGNGECGACTVLVDGRPVNSCLVLAAEAVGSEIVTIEGLARPGHLHPLQEAFMEHGGLQCGICTPGMIIAAKALLDENPSPTRDEIRWHLAGNLCRCTGYVKIIEAVEAAAARIREEATPPAS